MCVDMLIALSYVRRHVNHTDRDGVTYRGLPHDCVRHVNKRYIKQNTLSAIYTHCRDLNTAFHTGRVSVHTLAQTQWREDTSILTRRGGTVYLYLDVFRE